jgi:hypothetical protein
MEMKYLSETERVHTYEDGTTSYQKLVKKDLTTMPGWVDHNDNGPAFTLPDGSAYYYIEGVKLTKEEWLIKTSRLGKVLYG